MGKAQRKLIIICGQTATGKSDLAISIASQIGAEIISADSMQIYKGLEFLTFPPNEQERRTVPHYFVSFLDPIKDYNVAMFVKQAYPVAVDIWERDKSVVVVGGTGLYIKCLLEGIFFSDSTDKRLRQQLQLEAKKGCNLYEKLVKVDKESAEKIHPNDLRRIIRALEVFYTTGRPISYWKKRRQYGLMTLADSIVVFVLYAERKLLLERMKKRIAKITEKDLDSLSQILERGISITAEKVIGLKELKAVLEGKISLSKAKEDILKQTYQYARRQKIWFRHQMKVEGAKVFFINIANKFELEQIWKELF